MEERERYIAELINAAQAVTCYTIDDCDDDDYVDAVTALLAAWRRLDDRCVFCGCKDKKG